MNINYHYQKSLIFKNNIVLVIELFIYKKILDKKRYNNSPVNVLQLHVHISESTYLTGCLSDWLMGRLGIS